MISPAQRKPRRSTRKGLVKDIEDNIDQIDIVYNVLDLTDTYESLLSSIERVSAFAGRVRDFVEGA